MQQRLAEFFSDDRVAEPPPGHPGKPAGLLSKLQKKIFYMSKKIL
jgi:hypothetical protein